MATTDGVPSQTAKSFGSLVGIGPLGVPAFSNGTDGHFGASEAAAPTNARLSTGIKWQSVEFARRYLLTAKGCSLPSVPVAEGIWNLSHVIHTVSKQEVALNCFPNGSLGMSSCPLKGDLLVWKRTPKMPFGHVAVVTEVTKEYVRVAEQNYWEQQQQGNTDVNVPWPPGVHYSRELPMTVHDSVGTKISALNASFAHHPPAEEGGSQSNPTISPFTDTDGSSATANKDSAVFHTKRFEIFDKNQDSAGAVLGWMRVDMVDMDPNKTDWMDDYRLPIAGGRLVRHDVHPEVQEHGRTLPWLVPPPLSKEAEAKELSKAGSPPPSNPLSAQDFFLRRSLVGVSPVATAPSSQGGDDASAQSKKEGGSMTDTTAAAKVQRAPINDVPSGWYSMDYDLWMRLKVGSREVHKIALEACNYVLNHGNSEEILVAQFGIPVELHGHVRASFSTSPCLGGRFDFGFDGENKLKIFEYNSDSSAALLECGDTQGRWARYHSNLESVTNVHQVEKEFEVPCDPFGNPKIGWSGGGGDYGGGAGGGGDYGGGAGGGGDYGGGAGGGGDYGGGAGGGSDDDAKSSVHSDSTEGPPIPTTTMITKVVEESITTMQTKEQRLELRRGQHTGQHLFPRMVKAWYEFKNRSFFTPSQHKSKMPGVAPKIIHFLVDDDDEERYTALYTMKAAAAAGFSTKLLVGLNDLAFSKQGYITDKTTGATVQCVWKTWSWDTVIKDFEQQGKTMPTKAKAVHIFNTPSTHPDAIEGDAPVVRTPSLTEVLLRDDICVIEPIWKAVVGNKALLSYMHMISPKHPNLLETTFELTPELIGEGYVSKPVSGRAGQNISLHPGDPAKACAAAKASGKPRKGCDGLGKNIMTPTSTTMSTSNASFVEESGGRFHDSVVVYQEKLKIKPYGGYFPILCAWMIGDDFAGVVIREDTSQITKLGSIVAPARVVRY